MYVYMHVCVHVGSRIRVRRMQAVCCLYCRKGAESHVTTAVGRLL